MRSEDGRSEATGLCRTLTGECAGRGRSPPHPRPPHPRPKASHQANRAKAGRTTEVVLLGDSITDAWGLALPPSVCAAFGLEKRVNSLKRNNHMGFVKGALIQVGGQRREVRGRRGPTIAASSIAASTTAITAATAT